MRAPLAGLVRRAVAAVALLLLPIVSAEPALATPAEDLISGNIQKGFAILNDTKLSESERRGDFADFLLGITDLKRVAVFTLGDFGPKATEADRDAFADAFQRYAVAVYQSYFARYSGQTLAVTGSHAHAPGDDIVTTRLIDPGDPQGHPLEIDFRVRSDGPRPVIVDFAVAGVWLAPAERDEFTAFLGRNGGDIHALIAHLDELRGKLAAAP